MANRVSYIEFLIEQLSLLGEITTRRMFGGNVLYCDGIVFALVASDTLYLKADDANRAEFEANGLGAFHPFGDESLVMQYYQAPPEIFEDREELRRWVGGAVAAARRGLAKKAGSEKKRAARAGKTKQAPTMRRKSRGTTR
ncbi:MAG TPA: TfoX/Sxy family protein [Bryobacteraceae bacterium]|nr:TfoX/Sxy family protein [Bryobacteraceae bacterium]